MVSLKALFLIFTVSMLSGTAWADSCFDVVQRNLKGNIFCTGLLINGFCNGEKAKSICYDLTVAEALKK